MNGASSTTATIVAALVLACSAADDGPSIPVRLDGAEVGAIPLGQLSIEPRPLALLLDGRAGEPSRWVAVEARSTDERRFAINDVAHHADKAVHLRLDAHGEPEIGLFPRIEPGVQGPVLLLTNVTSVQVHTAPLPPLVVPDVVEPTILAVSVDGGAAVPLRDDRLAAIARLADRPGAGGEAGEHAGGAGSAGSADASTARIELHLADVADAFVTDGEAVTVTLVSEGGERMTIDGATLRSRDDPTPILKRNRRGEWVFQVRASDPDVTRRLRGVTALEVVPAN